MRASGVDRAPSIQGSFSADLIHVVSIKPRS
jgi:hypothetical protein